MDHALRTISYIADIGDLVVIMARRRLLTSPLDDTMRRKRQSKIICHVFESDEVGLLSFFLGHLCFFAKSPNNEYMHPLGSLNFRNFFVFHDFSF